MSGDERCPVCDRAECQRVDSLGQHTGTVDLDCPACRAAVEICNENAVDWRARCLAAEATLANQLQVTVVARQAVSDVVVQRNAAQAERDAMAPVVAAAEAWRDGTGGMARSTAALKEAIDTYRLARGKAGT